MIFFDMDWHGFGNWSQMIAGRFIWATQAAVVRSVYDSLDAPATNGQLALLPRLAKIWQCLQEGQTVQAEVLVESDLAQSPNNISALNQSSALRFTGKHHQGFGNGNQGARTRSGQSDRIDKHQNVAGFLERSSFLIRLQRSFEIALKRFA